MKKISFSLIIYIILLTACSPQTGLAATPTALAPAVTETRSAVPSVAAPTPEPTINPAIQAALGDPARNYYSVAPDGNAAIIEKGTNQDIKVEIVKAVDVKTNDGLAKDIKTGYDKDGNRFVYVEGYGWVNNKDFSLSTPENRLTIPYDWTIKTANKSTVLNTLFAFNYAQNPTISSAVIPQYSIDVVMDNNTVLTSQPRVDDINGNPLPFTNFLPTTKYFAFPGYLQTVTPDGKVIDIIVQTRLNPQKDKPKQVINMFFAIDDSSYQGYLTKKNRFGNSYLSEVIDSKNFEIVPVLINPTQIDGVQLPWDPNNWVRGNQKSPVVANLQKRGELISLLSNSEQNQISIMLKNTYNRIPSKGRGVSIDHIPPEFALYLLLTAFR